jgi:hypothetical protein
MIEVIGKSKTAYRKVTCANCGSRLRFVNDDVKSKQYTDYGGGSDTRYSIECPSCKKSVQVSSPAEYESSRSR